MDCRDGFEQVWMLKYLLKIYNCINDIHLDYNGSD
jgi:hypothetical protein